MLSGIIAKTTEFPLQLIGSVAGVSTARGGSDDDKAKRARRCFKREHMSVFEHVSVTWRIEGISRACSHQLVRHRLASFCQLSQRYVVVNTDADWYVIPPSIRDDDRMIEEYASVDYDDDSCPAEYTMRGDLVRRMEAVAARG